MQAHPCRCTMSRRNWVWASTTTTCSSRYRRLYPCLSLHHFGGLLATLVDLEPAGLRPNRWPTWTFSCS